MLDQFRFANFKSFRGEAIFDMTASDVAEQEWHVVREGDVRFLPAAVVFGANGSGKSNLIEAFRFMAGYVMNSGRHGDGEPPLASPFLFSTESRDMFSEFEVHFTCELEGQVRCWNYGFVVGANGVEEEWLNTKTLVGKKYSRGFYRSLKDGVMFLDGLPRGAGEESPRQFWTLSWSCR